MLKSNLHRAPEAGWLQWRGSKRYYPDLYSPDCVTYCSDLSPLFPNFNVTTLRNLPGMGRVEQYYTIMMLGASGRHQACQRASSSTERWELKASCLFPAMGMAELWGGRSPSMMMATVTVLPQAPQPNGLNREQMSKKSLTEMVPRHANVVWNTPQLAQTDPKDPQSTWMITSWYRY